MRMATESRPWTMDELHRLPDDGNRYELVHGELFVTPAPTDRHETIAARLGHLLVPYVEAHGLGLVYRPRAVIRVGREAEVEPDLMVRQPHPEADGAWETAPLPILVVEILSGTTRRRDFGAKRVLYAEELRIPEYWIVDGHARTVTVVAPDRETRVVRDRLAWHPSGAGAPLDVDLAAVFG